MEEIYSLVEMYPKNKYRWRFSWSHIIYIILQIVVNVAIYFNEDTDTMRKNGELKIYVIYSCLFIINIVLYYNVAFTNPGYIRLKDQQFNRGMDDIEAKYRNGEISFIEGADPKTTETRKRIKRTRKMSVLTKGMHRRTRSSNYSVSSVSPVHSKARYAEFQDEPDGKSTVRSTNSQMRTPTHSSRKKIIREASTHSFENAKESTTTVTKPNGNETNPVEYENTFRKVKNFLHQECRPEVREIKRKSYFANSLCSPKFKISIKNLML